MMAWVKADPDFDSLRSEPWYQAVLDWQLIAPLQSQNAFVRQV